MTERELEERPAVVDDDLEMRQRQLMAAVAGGDVDAFSELYDMFERPLFGVALRAVNDTQRAEDVVQEAFMKVWRSAAAFDPTKGAPGAWIFTIAKRTAIDSIRRQERVPVPSLLVDEPGSTPDAGDEEWMAWEMNSALATLPEDQRRVIDLFVISGFTHAEVAERLDIPLGTVKTRIYSGLKRLRVALRHRPAGAGP